MRTDVEEDHAKQHQRQVESLGAQVLFVEEGSSEQEADYHAAATYHGHDGNHSIRQRQRIEIHEVGSGQEDADTNDRPAPMEGGRLVMARPPQQVEHG